MFSLPGDPSAGAFIERRALAHSTDLGQLFLSSTENRSKIAFLAIDIKKVFPQEATKVQLRKEYDGVGPPVLKAAETLPRVEISWEELIIDESENSRFFYSDNDIELLAGDIAERGLIYPLVVYEENEKYKLKAGYRRARAINLLRKMATCRGHEELPFDHIEVAVIQVTGLHRDLYNISDNHQTPLTIIEMGRYIQRLRELHQVSVKTIAQHSGRSQSYMYACLNVVERCAPEIIQALERGLERHEFTGGNLISPKQLFKWAKMAPDKQKEEFNKWTGHLADDRTERRATKTVSPVRLRTYLDKIRDMAVTDPKVKPVLLTLEWVLRERPSPPLRISHRRKRRRRLL